MQFSFCCHVVDAPRKLDYYFERGYTVVSITVYGVAKTDLLIVLDFEKPKVTRRRRKFNDEK